MPVSTSFFTTKDAAKRIGVSGARIRQMLIQHEIGQKFANRDWMLTEGDIRQLESLPRRPAKRT